jgi:hypothetical protein
MLHPFHHWHACLLREPHPPTHPLDHPNPTAAGQGGGHGGGQGDGHGGGQGGGHGGGQGGAAAAEAAALSRVVNAEHQLWRAMRAKGHVELASKLEAHMAAPERAVMQPGARLDYLAGIIEAAGHGPLAEALRHFARP